MPNLAKRMSAVKPSPTVAVNNKAKALKAQGVDVINFSLGVPNFLPPQRVYDAAMAALKNDNGSYLGGRGETALLDAFQKRLQEDGFHYEHNEMTCALGAKNALNNLYLALMDENEEVIYPSPFWPSYEDVITMYGGINKPITCSAEANYKLTPQQLEEAITEKTKIFLFNNPSNPTGMVYTKEEIHALGEVLIRNPHVWVISDDLYDKMIYDGEKFYHLLHTHPELKERLFIVQSISKNYGMPGWRVGMVAGPKEGIDVLVKITGNTMMNLPAVTQAAAAEAFAGDHSFVAEKCIEFQKKRDAVMDVLNNIEGIVCPLPKGAFFVFPNISAFIGKQYKGETIKSDVHMCELLLDHAHVACVPGSAFGDAGALRISYSLEDEKLQKGLRQFKTFMEDLI